MFPSAHHFLATLFSKILLHSQSPPSSWCYAKVVTILKKDDTSDPGNFRPIAHNSVVVKLFHKIIATRIETHVLSNSIIDRSLQKGFLSETNGCIEQTFAMQSIISNAEGNSLPQSISFIDLKKCPHVLDMLEYMCFPVTL